MANVRGARGINNAIVVSGTAKQKDSAPARRLDGSHANWFPHERVEVAMFAQVAVLSGTVSRLSRRLDIEALVEQDLSIARVINKLDIA